MRRGEIWTASGAADDGGKPRPVVIVQDDRFDMTPSITVCGFTTDASEAPLFRLGFDPTPTNGLQVPCRLMIDKLITIAKSKIGKRVGKIADEDTVRLNRAIVVFLGIAGAGEPRET